MVKRAGRPAGKSAGHQGRGVMMGPLGGESGDPFCREKLRRQGPMPPVPQTDTGGLVEYTKAIERILVKELGKPLPCLRYKGDPLG